MKVMALQEDTCLIAELPVLLLPCCLPPSIPRYSAAAEILRAPGFAPHNPAFPGVGGPPTP